MVGDVLCLHLHIYMYIFLAETYADQHVSNALLNKERWDIIITFISTV